MRIEVERLLAIGVLFFTMATSTVRAQDPLQTLPNNYRLLYENEYVRVIDVAYAAHEKLAVHNHPDKPTVYVYLTDSGPVRFSHIEEHAFTLLRPPETAGTFRVSPGRLERHAVQNLGNIRTEFLRVELKQVPLGFQGTSFRSPKSFDATHSGVSIEFPGPFVKIQRVIAVGHQTAEIEAPDGPALLVAFSPISVERHNSEATSRKLKRGDVVWVNSHSSCTIDAADGTNGTAHLLQIIFLPKG